MPDLTSEPTLIRAGESVTWVKNLADYSAATYTLKYYLTGPQAITLTAAPYLTTQHKVTVTAAVSVLWASGKYLWESYAEKGSGETLERYFVASGELSVVLGTMAGPSHVKTVLDAIEDLIEGRAVADVDSYSIQGRSLSKMSVSELIKWRNVYKTEYARELDAARVAQGLDSSKRVGVRFRRI